MAEILSESEINQLLNAINASVIEPETVGTNSGSRKIKIYNFKRPEKFSKEQIRALAIIHETFSNLTSDRLSAQLRSAFHVHVASVDQLTYEEFIRSLPIPTTLALMDMEPLNGSAVLEIDPAISFAVIDRICGGIGGASEADHELSDIETSVMETVIAPMLRNLGEVWERVLDLRPCLRQINTNPQFVQAASPVDMVVLVTLEANMGDAAGMINICIPYKTIEPVIDKLPLCWQLREAITNNASAPDLDEVPVRLSAEVLRRDFSIKEILKWDTGTVILQNLSDDMQNDVSRRIVVLDRVSHEVTRNIERVLEKKLGAQSPEDYTTAGGIQNISQILNRVDSYSKGNIIKSFEDKDPYIAEEIRKHVT